MKIGVIGSRFFDNYSLVKQKLDYIYQDIDITLIVSGGAIGADTFGEKWADENGIEKMIFKPEWKKYGKKAGFIRNKDIVLNSDRIVAFWNGTSKGTLNSIDIATKHNIPVMIIRV